MGVSDNSGASGSGYDPTGFFCEIVSAAERGSVPQAVVERLRSIETKELSERAEAASRELYNLGITFTVYSDRAMIDRILPFDVLPRVIGAAEWDVIERGVEQRVKTLNLFIRDIYHDQKCLKDGIIPADLVLGNKNYRKQMVGLDVPGGTYVHVCGVDLVRDGEGNFCVLEDNARTPSGVSYVVENRHMMQRAFPDLMDDIGIRSVEDYGPKLLQAMLDVVPDGPMDPQVALLSPGAYNSAYFEHIFLAREMGVPLVEGRDLLVENDRVFMRTTEGLEEVHCLYRRIDDDFLDPKAFRPDSLLGVPGIFDAYRKGNVTLANAIGTGVADDKAVYAYMPRLIEYFLGEEAILPNVPTHICREEEGLSYTLAHLEDLVVKPVGESGGYGILIGPRATREELAEFRAKIKEDPANFISQPMINLSVCPTLVDEAVEPRHVDLRPFCVTGKSSWVLPGGLTRVALRKGSLVVNSSQGGGSKDTWVLTE